MLERTLKSLAAADVPQTFSATIVIENGGRDPRTADVVAKAPAVIRAEHFFVAEGNKSAALNAVLPRLQDELIIFLDDDVRVAPTLLQAYVTASGADMGKRFWGGPVGVDYEEAPPSWLVPHLPLSAVGWEHEGDGPVMKAAFLGFNWAARAADVKALGGFDPLLGPGALSGAVGQESDMQRRLLGAGWEGAYVEGARVWHWVPRSRCSPRWALRRAYRYGVHSGIKTNRAKGPMWLGVPRWAVGRALRALAMLPLVVTPSRARRFELLSQAGRSLGFVRGSRIGRHKSRE